jgi:hypothetical protein
MIPATIGPIEIRRTAVFSTHHASAQDLVAGRERPFTPPAYALLIGRARRFISLVTQLHIEVCGALQLDAGLAAQTIAVFATCHGEIQTAETLLADFRETRTAVGSTAPTTTVTGANAIAAGWLEAALTVLELDRPVLLSIADESVPAVFQGPSAPAGVAAAFLLVPAGSSGAGGAGGSGGRRAMLAIAPSGDERGDQGDQVSGLRVLGEVVNAVMRGDRATLRLGRIRPGAVLELCLPAEGTVA